MPGEKISYDGTYVMCLSLVIALGSFNAGYQIGVMNSLADVFKVKNGYNVSQEKIDRWEDVIWPLVNTILTICAAISSFCGDFLAAPLGRTKMMYVTNAITVIAAGVIQINGVAPLIIGRGIFGIAMGFYLFLSPMYITEVVPAADRGRFTSLHQLNIVLAICLGALLALAMPVSTATNINSNVFYRVILSVPIFIAILQTLLFMLLFKVESPKYLYIQGNEGGCRSVLNRMYYKPNDVDSIVSDYHKECESQKAAGKMTLIAACKMFKYAVLLGCFLSFVQQATGVNSIMYYSTPILKKILDENEKKAKIGTVLIDVAQIIFTVLALFIVDKVGRKMLFIIGSIGCGATQLLFGIFYNTKDGAVMTTTMQYLSLTMLVLFISFFSISHGPVCWSYLSEIMHPSTLTLAVCVNLIFTVIITYITEPAIRHIGRILFIIYAAIMFLSLILIIPFVKETKGKTSQEIAEMFSQSKTVEYTDSNSMKDMTPTQEVTEPLAKKD